MFSIRAYRETPSIEILCDGPNLPQGMPAAIRMEEGLAFIDPAPEGQKNTLTSPEATALALTSVGMSNPSISRRLVRWYGDEHFAAADSLYNKLDENRWGTRETTVATAFEKGFLIGESAPQLCIDPGLRQDFFNLTALLSTDHSPKEIAELLKTSPNEIYSTLGCIAVDTDFEFMEHPATAFITLAGMAELLPLRRDAPLSELTLPMTPAHESLFPTQELYFQPFNQENPHTQIRFNDQPINLAEPDLAKGHANQILIEGAIIDVKDIPFVAANGETMRLTPTELSYLALRSVGVTDKEAFKLLSINAYTVLGFYDKLLPPRAGKQRPRALEQSIVAAFEKGILVSRGEPEIHLNDHWRERLFTLAPLAAEGKTNEQAAAAMGISLATVHFNSSELQKRLDVKGVSSLVLMIMAKQFYRRNATPAITVTAA